MKTLRTLTLSLIIATCVFSVFNSANAEDKKPAGKTLYERLGGLPALAAVTDDFIGRLATDSVVLGNKVVVESLKKVNVTLLKYHVINQLCQATGGPCAYTGRDMKTTHKGMGITEAEWNSAATDLKATLDSLKVPAKEQDEVFAIVTSLKKDIVGQ